MTRALLLCSQAKCSVRLAGSSKSASLSLAVLCGLSREHRFSDQDTKHLGSSPSLTSVMGPTVLEASAGYALAALQPPQAPQTSLTARHCQQTGGKAGARPEWGGATRGEAPEWEPSALPVPLEGNQDLQDCGTHIAGKPMPGSPPSGQGLRAEGGQPALGFSGELRGVTAPHVPSAQARIPAYMTLPLLGRLFCP